MTDSKEVVRSAAARRDFRRIRDDYVDRGGIDLGLRFLDELQTAFEVIGTQPGSGSPQ